MAFNANDNIGLEMAERLNEDYSAPICLDNFLAWSRFDQNKLVYNNTSIYLDNYCQGVLTFYHGTAWEGDGRDVIIGGICRQNPYYET